MKMEVKNGVCRKFVAGKGIGIVFVISSVVAVVVTVMSGRASHSKSWSAVGSHGQCRPAGGRPDDTLARGFLFYGDTLFLDRSFL